MLNKDQLIKTQLMVQNLSLLPLTFSRNRKHDGLGRAILSRPGTEITTVRETSGTILRRAVRRVRGRPLSCLRDKILTVFRTIISRGERCRDVRQLTNRTNRNAATLAQKQTNNRVSFLFFLLFFFGNVPPNTHECQFGSHSASICQP